LETLPLCEARRDLADRSIEEKRRITEISAAMTAIGHSAADNSSEGIGGAPPFTKYATS